MNHSENKKKKKKKKIKLISMMKQRLIELGLATTHRFWVILCRIPEKGRREIEEVFEEMKDRIRGERKMNGSEETEEIKTFPLSLTCCKNSRPCPTVSQYQLDTPVT